jgi:hypothetical protein
VTWAGVGEVKGHISAGGGCLSVRRVDQRAGILGGVAIVIDHSVPRVITGMISTCNNYTRTGVDLCLCWTYKCCDSRGILD